MKQKSEILNLPNLLSFLRILLVAPFAACYLTGHTVWAWVVLGLSGLSDCLDGKLARSLNQVTELGKLLDPVADKITQATVAICLAVRQPLLWPLLGIFVLKELLMLLGGLVLMKKKRRPCVAQWYGKMATVLFYLSFATVFALGAIWHYESLTLTMVLLSITAGFMIYAFLRYAQAFVRLLRSQDPKDFMEFHLCQSRSPAPCTASQQSQPASWQEERE